MEKILAPIYQTFFNHFVRLDGYSKYTYIIAGAATGLAISIFSFNVLSILSLLINDPMDIIVPKAKGAKFLVAIIVLGITHVVLFSFLRFSKNGEDGSPFLIDKRSVQLVWIGFIIGFILLFILSFARMYYFKK